MLHIVLVLAHFAVMVALVSVGGTLIAVGWPGLWSAAATAQVIGGGAMTIPLVYVAFVVPGKIEHLTGREVPGGDASGAAMG